LHEPLKNISPRWPGRTVVCIASGPSLTAQDVAVVQSVHARGLCKVIAVNREFVTAPWADVLYAADYNCWKEYILDIQRTFRGELWTVDKTAARQFKLHLIKKGFGFGYSQMPGTINTGGNSGFQALHLAAYWGATRIFLLGYDMQKTDGKSHHYGAHRGRLGNGGNFKEWISRFKPLMRDLHKAGIEVFNLTRSTALPEEVIPRKKIEEVAW
jgi:hypothetical protein